MTNIAEPFIRIVSDIVESIFPSLGGYASYLIGWIVCIAIFFFLFMDVVKSIGLKNEQMSIVYVSFLIIAIVIGFIPVWVLGLLTFIALTVVFWRAYLRTD